jgi:hypothetical protein
MGVPRQIRSGLKPTPRSCSRIGWKRFVELRSIVGAEDHSATVCSRGQADHAYGQVNRIADDILCELKVPNQRSTS